MPDQHHRVVTCLSSASRPLRAHAFEPANRACHALVCGQGSQWWDGLAMPHAALNVLAGCNTSRHLCLILPLTPELCVQKERVHKTWGPCSTDLFSSSAPDWVYESFYTTTSPCAASLSNIGSSALADCFPLKAANFTIAPHPLELGLLEIPELFEPAASTTQVRNTTALHWCLCSFACPPALASLCTIVCRRFIAFGCHERILLAPPISAPSQRALCSGALGHLVNYLIN